MKTITKVSGLALTVCVLAANAASAQILPINFTGGYTADDIYGPGDTLAAGVSAQVPNNLGYQSVGFTGSTVSGGFPDDGTIVTSSGATFQLGSYTANNVALIGGNSFDVSNSTFTLATPGNYSDVSLLFNDANGGTQTYTVTLNFSNAASQVLTLSQNEGWINGDANSTNPIAFQNSDLLVGTENSGSPGETLQGYNITLYEADFAVNPADTLTSVNVAGQSSAMFFGLSGDAVQSVPEPSTCATLLAGLLGLVFYQYRRRRLVG